MPDREETRRSICFDFEGFTDQSPSLVGVLVEGQVRQVVLDTRLRSAAENCGLEIMSLSECGQGLLNQAVHEERLLAAYSTHELQVLAKHAGVNVRDRYVNVRKLAKQWHRRTWPVDPLPRWTLNEFLGFIEYPLPPHLGNQQTTRRLRAVLDGLAAKGTFEKLTGVQKGKWTKLLDHNRHDCLGMKELLDRVVSGAP